jgi:PBP1b-binding outer membrane lipoprotein LpoB
MTRLGYSYILLVLALLSGCVSEQGRLRPKPTASSSSIEVVPVGHGTALQFRGLALITDQIVNEILMLNDISASKTTPHVLLNPVINQTTASVNEQLLLGRMRVMLNSKARNKLRFLDSAMIRHIENQFAEIPNAENRKNLSTSNHLEHVVLESRLVKQKEVIKFEFILTKLSSRAVLWKGTYDISPDFFN